MCLERLILCVKHPWYLRRSRDLVSMPSAPPSSGAKQRCSGRGGGVTPIAACVSGQSTYSWLWGQLTRPRSLSHTFFSVIKVAKSRRGTRESTLTWLCLRGFVVRKVGGRAFSCLSVERRRRRRKAGLFGGLTTRSMLLTKMDLLNYQYLDKMNNNIGILCYEGRSTRLGCFWVLLCFFLSLVFWKLRQRKLAAPSFRWNELAQVSRSCVEKAVGSAVIWFVLRFFGLFWNVDVPHFHETCSVAVVKSQQL